MTLPLATVGGVLGVFLAGGGVLSLGSIVGFVAVFGVAVRNSTTLVNRYRHLERHNGASFGADLVQRATGERSGPVLLSAVTTALAVLPLALFGNVAGLEIVHPMAVVILGGLVTTTVFTLVVVPATYLRFGADREPDVAVSLGYEGIGIVGKEVPASS